MMNNKNNISPIHKKYADADDNEDLKILISAIGINTEVNPRNLQRNANCLKDVWNANYKKSKKSLIIPQSCYETLIEVFLENTLLLSALLNAHNNQ